MLELKLKSMQSTASFVRITFIPFWIIAMFVIGKFMDLKSGGITGLIVLGILMGAAFYGYFVLKFSYTAKALERYLLALKDKQFSDALTFGRMYYSMTRKGLFGADGSGLTVYDESAIQNDIAAYSTT
jgi:hypothetical protein